MTTLVHRKDITSLRDLKKKDAPWLRRVSQKMVSAICEAYPVLQQDQLKLYVHCRCTCVKSFFLLVWVGGREGGREGGRRSCKPADIFFLSFIIYFLDHPSYYHFHIHAVSIFHDGGLGQSAGKAFLLGNIISQLEGLPGDDDCSLADVEITYVLGEESVLWQKIFRGVGEIGSIY